MVPVTKGSGLFVTNVAAAIRTSQSSFERLPCLAKTYVIDLGALSLLMYLGVPYFIVDQREVRSWSSKAESARLTAASSSRTTLTS